MRVLDSGPKLGRVAITTRIPWLFSLATSDGLVLASQHRAEHGLGLLRVQAVAAGELARELGDLLLSQRLHALRAEAETPELVPQPVDRHRPPRTKASKTVLPRAPPVLAPKGARAASRMGGRLVMSTPGRPSNHLRSDLRCF